MTTCSKCILNDRYPGLTFNESGECSLCERNFSYRPVGEAALISELEKARRTARKRKIDFDVLVPLSGGKDSTYMLYLAAVRYRLRVLAMTYDNGLLSSVALDNIRNTTQKAGVQHIFYKPDPLVQQKVYQTMFRTTADICGACDIGTNQSILKVSHDHHIPLIFSGVSPLENDSFVPDSIQDLSRFRFIMKRAGILSKKELENFMIYPGGNYFSLSFRKRTGYFGKLLFPLFYIDNPTDKEMGAIIKRELGWIDSDKSEYTKHFDCIAEPFTNYARHQIYGYERHICQYSNMIRRGEITRNHAVDMLDADHLDQVPTDSDRVMEYLGVTKADLPEIFRYKPLSYEHHTSWLNRIFAQLMKIKTMITPA